jgi:hypothetical protein
LDPDQREASTVGRELVLLRHRGRQSGAGGRLLATGKRTVLAAVIEMPIAEKKAVVAILWMEFFIDPSTSVAFEREPPEPHKMQRPPPHAAKPLIASVLLALGAHNDGGSPSKRLSQAWNTRFELCAR